MKQDILYERLDNLKECISTRKKEFNEMLQYLENETEFFSAPASTKYHLCKEQGLFEHSLNTAETALALKKVLAPELSDESCVIAGLFHDLGKAGMPGNPQYLKTHISKNENRYGYQPLYRYNKDLLYLSVPVRSLYLLASRFPLTEEEVQAIVYHDGQYVDDNRSVAAKECKLTLLIQYADNWSGFIIEKGA